jgi:hypothetical protein
MPGRNQPPVKDEVRVVVVRREIEDPAGEQHLVTLIAGMLDRRRHSRGDSKR